MNIDEKDTELKEGQNPDDNSSQEACFVCHDQPAKRESDHRPMRSHLPGRMQKTRI